MNKETQKRVNKALGMSQEERDRLYEKARAELAARDNGESKDRVLAMLEEMLAELEKPHSFEHIEVKKIDDLTDEEFKQFVLQKLSILSKAELQMDLDCLKREVMEYNADEMFTIRETIENSLKSMVRAHEFSEFHHAEMAKADTKNLPLPDEAKEVSLSPAEILLLQYIDGKYVELGLPGYFTHDYHIDYEAAIKKFGVGGYLQYAGLIYTLNKLTVAQLKQILGEHGYKATGTKPKLIASVRSVLSPDEAENYGRKFFRLTERGQALIYANSHIKYFHSIKNKLGIAIETADKYKKAHPEANNDEIAIALLDEGISKSSTADNWDKARHGYYGKSIVCLHAGRKREELKYLLIVCYLDVEMSKPFQERHPGFDTFASGIISSINAIVQSLNLRADDLREDFENAVSQFYEQVPDYEIEQTAEYVSNAFQELLAEIKFNQG